MPAEVPYLDEHERISLARVWLQGYASERNGYFLRRYAEGDDDLRGRRALAQLLRDGVAPPDILDLLARSVMPDDEDVYDGVTSSAVLKPGLSERRLDFTFRKGKSRSRGTNRSTDMLQEGSILSRISALVYLENMPQTRAFDIVAAEVFLTPRAIRKKWERWQKALRQTKDDTL